MEKESLKNRVFNRKTIISFFISFVILYLLFSKIDIVETIAIIKKVDIFIYSLGFLCYYSSFPIRGLRWKTLLKNTGFDEKTTDLTEILFISWFANCLVPAKLGDFYRGYLLKRNYKISISKTMGTIFVERVFDIVILVVFLGLAALYSFGGKIPDDILFSLKIGYLIIIALMIILILMRFQKNIFLSFLPHYIENIFLKFEEGTSQSITKHTIPLISFYTLTIWFLESGRLYFVIKAIGLGISISAIIFISLASALLTSLPITPAGLGAVEVAITSILIIVGVKENISLSVALLDRFVSYWSLIIIGFYVYIISKRT